MGVRKHGLEVGGIRMVERVLAAARTVVDDVVLVGKAGVESPVPDLPYVEDDHPESCALAGVVAALRHAGDRPVLVLACDLPFLVPKLLRLLLDGAGAAPVRLPVVSDRLEPLVAVYRPAAFEPLAAALAEGRLALHREVAALNPDRVAERILREVDPGLVSFVNVNDRSDLAAARRREAGNR
jgi:molybdopterin-guanine dinucleotide biosynthesis protein A